MTNGILELGVTECLDAKRPSLFAMYCISNSLLLSN
jgi:hypothetical protein